MSQLSDKVGKLVPFGLVKGYSESGVAVLFVSLGAPFRAVLYTWHTGHTEKKSVNKGQMILVGEYACNTGNIVVIHESQQMLSAVSAPALTAELVFQRVAYLKHIHAVEA